MPHDVHRFCNISIEWSAPQAEQLRLVCTVSLGFLEGHPATGEVLLSPAQQGSSIAVIEPRAG